MNTLFHLFMFNPSVFFQKCKHFTLHIPDFLLRIPGALFSEPTEVWDIPF